ncbi:MULTISPECIES: serine/threonine-protein kinase [Streptomyces]|uniref:serine/threonine-protein kinase n=1 Tax=Streptomyces TaxID=1883 RepID=UPI001E2A4CF1|nr:MULTISPECIES: serine/threonine-protein kinase [Streptomyces]UFQ17048.1 serine/threonine protein kinase [Streptomyces huasconensis]WCL86648.1 serine/threonine-protein kinase [Streptomyces sp. JCM 35825]
MEKLGPGDPQRIGAYRLLARLGAGGMGQVYLARSGRGRTVAVKLVREELAEQDEFRNRFRQEVRAARRVGGAWTAPVLDADTEAAIPWVATGYVAGPSLQSVVSRDHGPLPERSVSILAAGLANALKDIHAAGIVHRDLKPSNVLVTIDGPRVIDFGIARALETVTDGGLTRTGALVGSPGFMAPEQVRGDRITPACDVFCLGSVLAYAASGALPFGTANSGVHALMFRIAQEEPDLSGLPENLAELIALCLRKDPASRPTLDDLLERTGAQDTLSEGGRTLDPWLPGALVAQLGRHAVQLLDAEDPDEAGVSGPAAAESPASGEGVAKGAGAVAGAAAAAAGSAPGGHEDNRASQDGAPRPGPGEANPAAPDAAPTPPPPGAPGAAPLDHLPTMVAGQAPPPSPPPGAPSYGYPQHAQQHPQHPPHPHPQPAAYGYPQQPPPGYGPTPPYGPGGYTPLPTPAPEPPPRRSGRSTAALVAVALIVAIGAGGTVYAVMNSDSGDKRDGSNNSASSDPSDRNQDQGPDPTSPSPDRSSPDPSPSTEDDEEGDVPDKFLGTWSGGLDNKHGHHTRRLTLQQGETGDTTLSLTAEGPLESGGTYRCVFEGELESASDERLHIGPTRITVGEPMSACTPGEPSVVTILGNGKLRRANTDGKGELTYDKAG